MLHSYLTIAWRTLWQRRFYSLLNIVGLAVGLAFANLIGAYAWGELTVNRQLRHAPQQCLLQSRWTDEAMGMPITTLAPLGAALRANYPALVANVYRFHAVSATISNGTHHVRESIQVGDSTLLTMYGFTLLHGDPRTALNSPNALVMTANKARLYFGRTDVLNQPLTVETPQGGKQAFLITGVLAPLPTNSVSNLLTEPNEVFLSAGALPQFGADFTNWQNPYIVTYLELQPGVRPAQLAKPMAQLIAANAPPAFRHQLTPYLTPLTDYYLDSNNGLGRRLLTTLGAIALFILLMAVVNFVNLSLGMAAARKREIGVRKALGGRRGQLMAQFLAEAFVLTSFAALLSVGLYAACRPFIAEAVGRAVPSILALPGVYVGGLLALVVLVSGGAGGYPALHLSARSAVDSLHGKASGWGGGSWLRRGLVTVQFTIAIVVFVGAVVVSRQIAWFFSTDLGFNKEALLTVSSLPRTWTAAGVARMEAARDQLARLPGVQAASLSYEIPNGNVGNTVSLYRQGRDSTQAVVAKIMTTDEHYAHTYGLRLRAGQYFHAGQGGYDSTSVVLNEAALRALGYTTPATALGQVVRFQNDSRPYRVRGIVGDFHVGTLHERVGPLVVTQVRLASIYRFFSFRLAAGNPQRTIAALEGQWRARFPDAPFDYAFMDQTLAKLYQTERQLERAAYIATALALLMVLLGVVGLVSLSVARRTKEIGIRKVLGASALSVLGLFLREYAWLMLLANAIAWPLTYWLVSNWLRGYAYHAPLTAVPFVGVGLGVALLTSLVVGAQVLRTALVNPVTSLRAE